MPTVVLVHGANHGPWCWDRLVPHLDGFRVIMPDLYCRPGLSPAAPDVVQEAIDGVAADGPVIVVGHSFGGLAISQLAPETVDHVVYLAALVAVDDPTERLGDPVVGDFLDAMHLDDGLMTPRREALRRIWYGDCSDDDIAWCAAQLRPHPLMAIPATIPRAVYKHVPATYVTCERDGSISAPYMARASALIGRGLSLPTSHSPFLSQPALLAGIIRDLC
jgi:pimeloyl-ACP methyl ester carboxylesterase